MDLSSGPEVLKLFSCSTQLSRVEHELLNAHKCKMSRNSAFLGSDQPRMLFFPLINVKNANNSCHFIVYEQEKFHARLS